MPIINPKNLRMLRDRRGMTLDQLAEKAVLDRGTINKIERSPAKERRSSTARKLALALEVDVAELTGPMNGDLDGSRIYGRKSQYNFQMAEDARNALTLVAQRYNVKPTAIMHIAPLLFLWAAESSLRKRKEALDQIHENLRSLISLQVPPHIGNLILDNWRGDEALESERRSIASKDLFGITIPSEHLPPFVDYDIEGDNPMANFLSSLTSSVGDLAKFDSWSPYEDQPYYELCQEDVEKMTGGDWRATRCILDGSAPLRAMPKHVRDGGPAAVAAWAIEEGEKDRLELLGDDPLQHMEDDDD